MTPAEVVDAIVPRGEPAHASGEAYVHANLALVKYWGKRDDVLNLPVTDSLSISLGPLGTRTRLALTPGLPDTILLDGEPVAADVSFARRLTAFLDLVRPGDAGFRVETRNTVPTGAGLASSASGFAALVVALDKLFGWGLDAAKLSVLARLGSGSACRSLYGGFVRWRAGERADGMDSLAEPVPGDWPELRIGVLTLAAGPKAIGSRPAMAATRDQSALYAPWPELCRRHLGELLAAIAARDLPNLGRIAESNALSMHATMLGAWPPILYWQPASVEALHRLWATRAAGVAVYGTMDAGPNLKLLFEAADTDAVREAFPDVRVVAPFQTP